MFVSQKLFIPTLCLGFVLLHACSDDTQPTQTPWLIDDSEPDATPDLTSPEDMRRTTPDMRIQPDMRTDMADMASPPDKHPADRVMEVDLSLWRKEASGCKWARGARPSNEPFEKPPLQNAYPYQHGPLDKAALNQIFGLPPIPKGLVAQTTSFSTANRADAEIFNVYAAQGEGLKHYYGVVSGRSNVNDLQISLTALVDFKPVEATFRHYGEDREEVVAEHTGSGWRTDSLGTYQFFDIEFPPETFSETRTHNISLAVELYEPQKANSGVAHSYNLHHGGFSRPPVPCYEEPQQQRSTFFEREMIRVGATAGNQALLFPDKLTNPWRLVREEAIRVAPGEEVDLNVSLTNPYSGDGEEAPVIMVPVMDGEPIGPPWRVGVAFDLGGDARIDARKHFTATMPEEPGEYYVNVMTWMHPESIQSTRDGVDAELPLSTGSSGSGTLRFLVTEDGSSELSDPAPSQ